MNDKLQKWEATGRRKESCARVRLVPGTGRIFVNKREGAEFFRRDVLDMIVRQPMVLTETDGRFDIHASVKGGGNAGGCPHPSPSLYLSFAHMARGVY